MIDTIRSASLKAAGARFPSAGAEDPYIRPEQLRAWRSGRTLDTHSDLVSEIGSLLQKAAGSLADETPKPDQALYQELITLHARAAGEKSDKIFRLNGQTVDTLSGILAARRITGNFVNSGFFAADDDIGPDAIEALELLGLERVGIYRYHFAPRPATGSSFSHAFHSLPLAHRDSPHGIYAVLERPLEVCNI